MKKVMERPGGFTGMPSNGDKPPKGGKGPDKPKKVGDDRYAMKVDGEAAPRRGDRPGRKFGGRIGADTSPMSTAARVKDKADFGHRRSGDGEC